MQIRKFIYEYLNPEENQQMQVVENDNKPAPAEIVPEVPEVVLPPAIYTEQQLQDARSYAREDGIREGQELAKAQFLDAEARKTEMLSELIQKIEAKVLECNDKTQKRLVGITDELKPLALAAVKKTGGFEGATEFIKEQVEKLSSKGELKIMVSPENADVLAGKFNKCEVAADAEIANQDFRIEWDGGFAERKVDEIWLEIENILRK